MNIIQPNDKCYTEFTIGHDKFIAPLDTEMIQRIYITQRDGLPKLAEYTWIWEGEMYKDGKLIKFIPRSDFHKHQSIIDQIKELYEEVKGYTVFESRKDEVIKY